MNFANFIYFCITHGKLIPLCGNVVSLLPYVIQKYTKFTKFTELYFPQFTIFATKLHNFTKLGMLFLAVLTFLLNSKVCLIGNRVY